jgi:hypothetical protein
MFPAFCFLSNGREILILIEDESAASLRKNCGGWGSLVLYSSRNGGPPAKD